MEFQDLISYKALHEQDSVLFSQVETVYNLVKHTINSISVFRVIFQKFKLLF